MDQSVLLLTGTRVRRGTSPGCVYNKKSLLEAVQGVCRGRKRLASTFIIV